MFRVNNASATPGGYSDSGDTSIGSPTITNLSSTAGVNVGDYITVAAGFPDVGRMRVIAKGANTLTVNLNATSNETGKAVASVANMYTDGVLGAVARTILNSKHLNAIQEELCNLCVAAGLSLDEANLKQVIASVVLKNGDTMTGDLILNTKLKTNDIEPKNPSNPITAAGEWEFSEQALFELGVVFQNAITLSGSSSVLNLNNRPTIKSEFVFEPADLTTIGNDMFKITLDAGSYNTFRFYSSSAYSGGGNQPQIFININGGLLGQEIEIINDTYFNIIGGYGKEAYLLKMRSYSSAIGGFYGTTLLFPQDVWKLRRFFTTVLPVSEVLRCTRYPGEGTTAYLWRIIGGSNTVFGSKTTENVGKLGFAG